MSRIDDLAHAVAPAVLLDAVRTSQRLTIVHALLASPADVAEVRAYLGQHAPELVPVLARLAP